MPLCQNPVGKWWMVPGGRVVKDPLRPVGSLSYEKDFSTQQQEACQEAWLPTPDVHPGRQGDHQGPPSEGPAATFRMSCCDLAYQASSHLRGAAQAAATS